MVCAYQRHIIVLHNARLQRTEVTELETDRLMTEWPQPELPRPPRLRQAADFLAGRIRAAYRRDTPGWKAASIGISVNMAALLAVTALGLPTGFGYLVDASILVVFGTAALWGGGALLAVLFSLLMLPLPRLFTGIALLAAAGGTFTLYAADLGWAAAAVAAIFTAAGGAAGGLVRALALARRRPIRAAASLLAAAAAVTAAAGILPAGGTVSESAQPAMAEQTLARSLLGSEDPLRQGSYPYRTFTYGSGTDKHRHAYGEGADIRTQPVDASGYITRWPALRTRFWGFDQHALPLNGRVWMPEGEGPFPLVFIVHGNHLMEDFSDDGYGYLAEHLASRGMIAVSVDENFLNYSVWTGIPNHDMKMRAWLLLHHLREIAELTGTPGNLFTGKADLSQVAMIGHSRGGQAAAMAADRSRWFAADDTLADLEGLRVSAVAAIAPTDTNVDKKAALLRDVNYLTIHGARDADVHNFNGDEQYMRTTFTQGTDGFKASIYLDGANHGQFNTTWGRYDQVMPGGLLLNTTDIMDAAQQQEAAKAYITAFLEASLHGSSEYAAVFSDPLLRARYAGGTNVIGRFESGAFHAVSRFEQPGLRSLDLGVTATADGASYWKHEASTNRDGNSKGNDGLVLQWEDEASYRIAFDNRYWMLHKERPEAFAFSLANQSDRLEESGSLEIGIRIEGADGAAVTFPLARFDRLQPLPQVKYMIHPELERRFDNGKFKSAVEPVYQTFIVPLDDFASEAPELIERGIRSITLQLRGGPGKVIIDDLGFYTARTR